LNEYKVRKFVNVIEINYLFLIIGIFFLFITNYQCLSRYIICQRLASRFLLLASKQRILDSCERANIFGARSVVFHAGFYQQKTAEQTYALIKKAIVEIQQTVSKAKWKVQLCPEVTGKPSQFGSLEELLKLMKQTGCGVVLPDIKAIAALALLHVLISFCAWLLPS
jgi:hypothetical protein